MQYLKIQIQDSDGEYRQLPFPTAVNQPTVRWSVPEGVAQQRYCLELKTRDEVTLSSGERGYAYYNSGIVDSPVPEHQVVFPMHQRVWKGLVEVRIRLYNRSGDLLYTTHPAAAEDYPFEPVRQGYAWDSPYDGYYYLLDTDIERSAGTRTPTFRWLNSSDTDTGQTLSYQLEYGDTPLFGEGAFAEEGKAVFHTVEAVYEEGAFSTLSPEVDISGAVFYRVRAYDGLDYSPWSEVNGFYHTPNVAPTVEFVEVVADCSAESSNADARPDGEIYVSFIVHDEDSSPVTAYLTFTLGTDTEACSLGASSLAVPANRVVTVAWLSARQLPNQTATVYLRLQAYDGVSRSAIVTYQTPIYINNRGLGYGTGDVGGSKTTYYVDGRVSDYRGVLQIPREKAELTSEGYAPITPPRPKEGKLVGAWDWGAYWLGVLQEEHGHYIYGVGDELMQRLPARVRRQDFALYSGWGDGKQPEIRLLYEDEAGESFVEYYDADSGKLGHVVDNIRFFYPTPLYGVHATLHRPRIVRAGTTGLYYDGMNLEGDYTRIYRTDDEQGKMQETPGTLTEGVGELEKKPLYKNFYHLDKMYVPEIPRPEKGTLPDYTYVGKNDPYHYDGTYYCHLFEYTLVMLFPMRISRGKSDRYCYEHNGERHEGSLLEEDESARFIRAPKTVAEVSALLERLFPPEIFRGLQDSDCEIEESQVKARLYSGQSLGNRSFRFLETEGSCYALFGIDTDPRVAQRIRADGTQDEHAIIDQAAQLDDPLYELPMDGGDVIDTSGETNEGEPLFTCDRDHVNEYGAHYRYSRKRFLLTGRIYVRKYTTRSVHYTASKEPMRGCEHGEASAPEKGYCRFRLEYAGQNALGERQYVRVYENGIGGVPAVCREVTVKEGDRLLTEKSYWDPENEESCLSHSELQDEPGVYERKDPRSFAEKIGYRVCHVAEYIDMEEAFEKPFIDRSQGGDPINRRSPVALRGSNPFGYIQYVLGAYRQSREGTLKALEEDRALVANDGEGFASVVESGSSEGNYGRFSEAWDSLFRSTERVGILVEPFLLELGGREAMIGKFGHQSWPSLESYFKIDGDGLFGGRTIPPESDYVHAITVETATTGIHRGRVHTSRRLLSDRAKAELPPDEGVKAPYLDYRLTAGSPLQEKDYFSYLEVTENQEYVKRPIGPYGDDRPLRIRGYIDSMSQLTEWRFIYLQTEWNTYNLIHWEGDQSDDVYARIECGEVGESGQEVAFMPLRTKSAEWSESLQCYLVPFRKFRQSDCLDTLNGTMVSISGGERTYTPFREGGRYQFRISGVNIHTGAATDTVLSTTFTYSKDAYAQPVITDIDYNKWKKEFTLTFRLDDHSGRLYDIVGLYYAGYEEGTPAPPESTYSSIDLKAVTGQQIDLASNTRGDDVISESHIIYHKIYVPLTALNTALISDRLVRFRMEVIASEDREGITVPVFTFRMWANEFLKQSDDTIDRVAGRWNRWVLMTYYDENHASTQKWVYVPAEEAVFTPGTLAQNQADILEIEERFEAWYHTVAKYEQPGFDAKYSYLMSERGGDAALYEAVFGEFVAANSLAEDYSDFCEGYEGKTEDYTRRLYIQKRGLSSDFRFRWENRAAALIEVDSGFSRWYEVCRVLSEAECRAEYIENEKQDEYATYLKDNDLYDDDETRLAFIQAEGLEEEARQYAAELNRYTDGRYREREAIVAANREDFEAWLASPADAFGNALSADSLSVEDEQYRLFIAHDRTLFDSVSYRNAGRAAARRYFLTGGEYGITYGQRLQTAYRNIERDQRLLSEAYRARGHYETLFRRRIVAQGYFVNGWRNNQVYTYDPGKEGDEPALNDVFQFRVASKPASGSIPKSTTPIDTSEGLPTETSPVAGYDTRWDIYYHFQLDFYDSFDSQGGRPLRDYLWMNAAYSGYAGSDVETVDGVGYIRILAGIEADAGVSVLPGQTYTSSETGSPVTNNPYNYQFVGRFAIPKAELPGELEGDTLPPGWSRNTPRNTDDFNHLYFWRVRPYNLLNRPVWEREASSVAVVSSVTDGYWRASLTARLFGGHLYCTIAYDYRYYRYMPYIYVARAARAQRAWLTDEESPCHLFEEPYVQNYFAASDADRMDMAGGEYYTEERASYQSRLSRGEAVFLTDRPRAYADGRLSYIQDENNQFRGSWVQYSPLRRTPWVVKDAEAGCYHMVCVKECGSDGETALTLARGLSPQTWGEVEQMFPLSTLDSPADVIEGAVAFDQPCLLKAGAEWWLYFRVRLESGYGIYRATSRDLLDWDGFTRLSLYEDISYPAVYQTQDGYALYCVSGTAIERYTSADGLEFVRDRTVFAEMYRLTRPTLSNGRVYFGMEQGDHSRFCSVDEAMGYDSLQTEKGTPMTEMSHQPGEGDAYFEPFTLGDTDKGCAVVRCYYESAATPYAYVDETMEEIAGAEEPALFTEYLEEYEWEKVYITAEPHPTLPAIAAPDGSVVLDTPPYAIPLGHLDVVFRYAGTPLAVKIPLFARVKTMQIRAEGEWIDFHNVGQTAALLQPEEPPDEYSLERMTTSLFISREGLTVSYRQWLEDEHREDSEESRVMFLISAEQYSVYLKWAYHGAGVWRYLSSVKRETYWGE